jgi:hypothetical protein
MVGLSATVKADAVAGGKRISNVTSDKLRMRGGPSSAYWRILGPWACCEFKEASMSRTTEACIEVLKGAMGLSDAAAKSHPLTKFVETLETKAKAARWAYPLLYLATGVALVASVQFFDVAKPDSWNKLFGAVVAVFSALLAFWKPDVELKPADCTRLAGIRFTSADIAEINKGLALPSKTFDNVTKLVGAIASFVATYLLLGI